MNENKISRIIARKTSLYLKFSLILFVLSLMLLSTAFLFVRQQSMQLDEDFKNNPNVHLITITMKMENGMNNIDALTFSDEREIQEIAGKAQDAYAYSEYAIPFGISDDKNNTYFIKGINSELVKRFDLEALEPNEAIGNSQIKDQNIVLKVPYINVESGGFTSHSTSDLKIRLITAPKPVAIFDELDTSPDTIFVNTKTLQNIVSTIYQTTWDEFKINYDRGNPYGLELIRSIRVYVDDLNDVRSVANQLKTEGYQISYVLGSFDDLQGSLAKTYAIYGVLLLFILVITAVNIIVSFRGYLFSMQKDMGIFRHHGYDPNRLYRIYQILLIRPYVKVAGFMAVYILVLSLILLHSDFLGTFILAFLLVMIFVGVVLAILLRLLRALCKKGILTLLKHSKEVE